MKRSGPIRRTPLPRSTTPIKRSPIKRGRGRPESTPSADERAFVLSRDGACMAAIMWAEGGWEIADPGPCEGPPTYGHARTAPGGFRPPAGPGIGRFFAVQECLGHNLSHWEARSDARHAINRRLDALYPGRRQHERGTHGDLGG